MHLFGDTRDEWMAADMEGWLAPNRIYPGVADAVRALMEHQEVYIVTTKQVGAGSWGLDAAVEAGAARTAGKAHPAPIATHLRQTELQSPFSSW